MNMFTNNIVLFHRPQICKGIFNVFTATFAQAQRLYEIIFIFNIKTHSNIEGASPFPTHL